MKAVVAPDPRRARAGRRVGQAIFHTLYRGVHHHAERVPMDGPVILVANHAAFLDGPLVFSLAPRPVNFLVKQEAFHGPFGWVISQVGQIPIDRSVGDRTALATASAVLERGGAVGIFPEGTRNEGHVEEVNQGAAWIALRTRARIVPVAVLGTRVEGASPDAWPRPRATLVVDFGEPFALEADPSVPGRDRLRSASDQLRDALASHVRRARVENGASTELL
ncbi:glycerol acyltransferase [Intrasporangium oryzae NRRL B-24470]|uniref:Glycerol acyltransferase n=1 Tax=Intrasporangium oryzae NRRL B-24470 TaxID=1386089 RepID=W9GA20_9MICO|nr:lysophospholipid acyltransferase family protein [Intrasporangium oryzae]EWT01683.1 glycerol acyltransferase [Intrasporangium oryzae NRRL B-24470]